VPVTVTQTVENALQDSSVSAVIAGVATTAVTSYRLEIRDIEASTEDIAPA
jgi:hypothetical protein